MYKFAKRTHHQKSQIDNEEKVATSLIDRVKGRKCGELEYCCLKPIKSKAWSPELDIYSPQIETWSPKDKAQK